MRLPPHAVVVSKLPGAPYSSHSLYVDGTLIRSQLSPYTDDEIAEYIREHLQPSHKFGVNVHAIDHVRCGDRWRHVVATK